MNTLGTRAAGWLRKNPWIAVGSLTLVSLLAGLTPIVLASTGTGNAELAAGKALRGARGADVRANPESPAHPAGTVAAGAQVQAVGPRFSISCPDMPVIGAQNGDAVPCFVISIDGFSDKVDLACVEAPAGLTCRTDPASVTPQAGQRAQFHLAISNDRLTAGHHSFKIKGVSSGKAFTLEYPYNLGPGSQADTRRSSASIACGLPDYRIKRGSTITGRCEASASDAFDGALVLSCQAPQVITCSMSPDKLTPRYPERVYADLIVTVAHDAPLGDAVLTVRGASSDLDFDSPYSDLKIEIIPDPVGEWEHHFGCSLDTNSRLRAELLITIPCFVSTGSLPGTFNLAVEPAQPGGPALVLGPSPLRLGAEAFISIDMPIDTHGVAPGVYAYLFTIRRDGANPYLPLPPTHSFALNLEIVEPPPAPGSGTPVTP